MLEVGFKAMDISKSCPELIPPKIPPELFDIKPPGVIRSLWAVPF